MKLIRTSFFSAIITFIKIASNFVSGKIVAIFTGPSGVGLIGQFSNFITIMLTFSNGAINSGVVKMTAESAEDQHRLASLFSTSLKISLGCSFFMGAVIIIFGSQLSSLIFFDDSYHNVITVLGATIFLYSVNTLLISILNGKGQIKVFTLVNTIGSIAALIFTVVLVFYFKIAGALYALVLAQSVVCLFTIAIIYKSSWFSIKYFTARFDKAIAKQLSGYSLMAIVTALTAPVSQMVLRNYIAQTTGVANVGFWQGMMRVSDGYLMIITTSLSTYYLPKMASIKNDADMRKEIFYGYKIILPAVLLGCLLIYFLRFFIIKVLYTPEFFQMESLFKWQLIGDFFKMAAWVLAYLMIAKAMTKHYIITEIIFTVTFVMMAVLFIHFYGIQGVTLAFAINYVFYLIIMVVIFRKILFNGKS